MPEYKQIGQEIWIREQLSGKEGKKMSQLILIIDDSLTVRKILETCLERAGYEVKSFADGVQALCWLNSTEVTIPALIFIDLDLPKLNGYEVTRRLKAQPCLEQTMLVILSGRDGVLDRLKGRLAGAHLYLTKPFKRQTILAVVQTHLPSLCEATLEHSYPSGGSL